MTKPKTKKRGDDPDPEIVRLAGIAAGLLAEVFEVDKRDLLDRPRPAGKLRCVRDLLIGVLHHHFCFNAKTGEVARLTPGLPDRKHWSMISQQRIAVALGRDRGVISDAAHEIEDAVSGDVGVGIAMSEITESIATLVAQADAWRAALKEEMLAAAVNARRDERQAESAVLDRVERDLDEIPTPPAGKMRCHNCQGRGKVRVHRLGGDPAYRTAWAAANACRPSADGFQTLECRFCDGKGQRALPAAASGAAILSASAPE